MKSATSADGFHRLDLPVPRIGHNWSSSQESHRAERGGTDVKPLWIGRGVVVLLSLTIGLLLCLRNTGVREVHPPSFALQEVAVDANPSEHDWPWWRGTEGNNVVKSSDPPVQWSASDNIEWKVSVPGRGHASPCLWGDKIFLSTAEDEQKTTSLLCLDRDSGRSQWRTELHRGGFMQAHEKNTQASSTPACDGQQVFVANMVDGSLWVTAVDFAGMIVWRIEAGPYSSEWGYGSSVAIHKSVVIVSADNRGSGVDRLVGSSWIAALSRSTGEIVWRVKRPEGDSFGSPVVAQIAGRDQLVLAGKEAVTSYDPLTGVVIWSCGWDGKRTANTVAFDALHVFASTRQPQSELLCIRADGKGDVTKTHVVWSDKKAACDVPSPCVHEGRLYVLADDGILNCLNCTDGRTLWKKRLGGNVSSSPLIAGGHLYSCNEDGITFVVSLTGRGEIVSENSLGSGILASPIVSRDKLYIRTLTDLFCVSARRTEAVADKQEESRRRS